MAGCHPVGRTDLVPGLWVETDFPIGRSSPPPCVPALQVSRLQRLFQRPQGDDPPKDQNQPARLGAGDPLGVDKHGTENFQADAARRFGDQPRDRRGHGKETRSVSQEAQSGEAAAEVGIHVG